MTDLAWIDAALTSARLQAVAYALKTQGPTATFIGETVWSRQDRA